MPKRLLLSLLITFLPLTAAADDPSTATSAGLGPQTSSSAGSSSADAGSLQPAGVNPLQSNSSGSSGLTAPSDSLLQAPATSSDTLQVLSTEADGPPQQTSDSTSNLGAWIIAAILLAAIAAAIVIRDRRRFRQLEK